MIKENLIFTCRYQKVLNLDKPIYRYEDLTVTLVEPLTKKGLFSWESLESVDI